MRKKLLSAFLAFSMAISSVPITGLGITASADDAEEQLYSALTAKGVDGYEFGVYADDAASPTSLDVYYIASKLEQPQSGASTPSSLTLEAGSEVIKLDNETGDNIATTLPATGTSLKVAFNDPSDASTAKITISTATSLDINFTPVAKVETDITGNKAGDGVSVVWTTAGANATLTSLQTLEASPTSLDLINGAATTTSLDDLNTKLFDFNGNGTSETLTYTVTVPFGRQATVEIKDSVSTDVVQSEDLVYKTGVDNYQSVNNSTKIKYGTGNADYCTYVMTLPLAASDVYDVSIAFADDDAYCKVTGIISVPGGLAMPETIGYAVGSGAEYGGTTKTAIVDPIDPITGAYTAYVKSGENIKIQAPYYTGYLADKDKVYYAGLGSNSSGADNNITYVAANPNLSATVVNNVATATFSKIADAGKYKVVFNENSSYKQASVTFNADTSGGKNIGGKYTNYKEVAGDTVAIADFIVDLVDNGATYTVTFKFNAKFYDSAVNASLTSLASNAITLKRCDLAILDSNDKIKFQTTEKYLGNQGAGVLLTAPTEVNTAQVTLAAPATDGTPAGVAGVDVLPDDVDKYEVTGITWTPNDNPFEASKEYSAKIVLTAKAGYEFGSSVATTVTSLGATVSGVVSDGSTLTITVDYPATVSTTQPLNTADITIPEPDDGDKVSDITIAKTNSSDEYTIVAATWTSLDGAVMGANDEFEGGESYEVEIALKANLGYAFASPTSLTVNSQSADVGSITVGEENILTFTYEVTVADTTPAETPISAATITIDAPVYDTEVGDAEATATETTFGIATSWALSTATTTSLASDAKFASDTDYIATITLTATGDNRFTAGTTLTVNGVAASATSLSGDGLTLTYVVTLTSTAAASEPGSTPTSLTTAIATVIEPEAGMAASAATADVPTGANYDVDSIEWVVGTGTPLSGSDKFASGTTYTATVVLKASVGYKFATTTSLTVNGGAVGCTVSEDGSTLTFEFTHAIPAVFSTNAPVMNVSVVEDEATITWVAPTEVTGGTLQKYLVSIYDTSKSGSEKRYLVIGTGGVLQYDNATNSSTLSNENYRGAGIVKSITLTSDTFKVVLDGYTDGTYSVSVTPADYVGGKDIKGSTATKTFNIVLTPPASTPTSLTTAIATVTAPVAGLMASSATADVPIGANYDVHSIEWAVGTGTPLDDSDIFDTDTTYTATVVLKAGVGYKFASSTSLTVNDEDVDFTVNPDGSTLTFSVDFTTSSAPVIIYGDVNRDGAVNDIDVVVLKRFVSEWPDVEINEDAADLNGDTKITDKDVTILKQYLAGWISAIPVDTADETE